MEKGDPMKAHDFRSASMCYTCHARCDQGADLSKAERIEMWEDAHRKTIGWLFLNDHVRIFIIPIDVYIPFRAIFPGSILLDAFPLLAESQGKPAPGLSGGFF
jgi:hypothetical protein